jgi:hypothetical protein
MFAAFSAAVAMRKVASPAALFYISTYTKSARIQRRSEVPARRRILRNCDARYGESQVRNRSSLLCRRDKAGF